MTRLFHFGLALMASLLTAAPAEPGLSRRDAETALQSLWTERITMLKAERTNEFHARVITHAGLRLRWEERVYGDPPTNGHSLWISMHGGGGAPAAVNDQQWRNQVNLYKPEEGIYIAPRGPTDHWNLWHESHIDAMFDRLIEDYVVLRGVDPNRVYIMGYSAGGDGVWQLAPRMADRWAAAAMMAGHPNDASLLPLRNLAFALFVGANDRAFNRNKIVAERAVQLDELQKGDPDGYEHMARIYPGLPHWMNRKDAEAVPWMAAHTRKPWPKKVVWVQDDVPHTRFYWLSVPAAEAKAGRQIVGEVTKQTIQLKGDVPAGAMLRLNDALIDLDKPVRVVVNGRNVLEERVPRTRAAMLESLQERADVPTAATARITLP